jgi:hypothetical protein
LTAAQIEALVAGAADETSETDLASKRWKITVGLREIARHKQFEMLTKAITLIKDVGNAAASLDLVDAAPPFGGVLCADAGVSSVPSKPLSLHHANTDVDGHQ